MERPKELPITPQALLKVLPQKLISNVEVIKKNPSLLAEPIDKQMKIKISNKALEREELKTLEVIPSIMSAILQIILPTFNKLWEIFKSTDKEVTTLANDSSNPSLGPMYARADVDKCAYPPLTVQPNFTIIHSIQTNCSTSITAYSNSTSSDPTNSIVLTQTTLSTTSTVITKVR